MTGTRPQAILYVVSRWRAPTQTFVRREVDAARHAGRDVVVLSLKRPVAVHAGDPPVLHLGGLGVGPALVGAGLRHPVLAGRAVGRAALLARPRTLGPNVVAVLLGIAATRRVPPVDWVHAHFAWVAASAADGFAAVRSQPYSVFAHAHDVFAADVLDRYTGDKLRRAAFVAVESVSIKDEVDDRFGCRAEVARMGVSAAFLERPPRPGGPGATVVSIGSLVPKKGHDDLLRAVAGLPRHVSVAIAGDGPLAAELRALASALGITDRVRWVGSVPEDDVADLLDSAAVFCLASKPTASGDRDGVPNVLIEAMGRKVPCVSTAVSGIPDLLGEDRGIVVPPGDVESLRAALAGILADPQGAAAMARRGYEHVAERYRTDRNWAILEAHMGVAV